MYAMTCTFYQSCCCTHISQLIVFLASWILDLLSLPTKFVTKKLKELKTVLQSSFHHAPCIRVSTKGPLSLRDLQNLTPSHSELMIDGFVKLLLKVLNLILRIFLICEINVCALLIIIYFNNFM